MIVGCEASWGNIWKEEDDKKLEMML